MSGTPVHKALPTRLSPTSFDTHASVAYRSINGSPMRSWYVNVISLSTMPLTVRVHSSASTVGTTSALSMR